MRTNVCIYENIYACAVCGENLRYWAHTHIASLALFPSTVRVLTLKSTPENQLMVSSIDF